jgi:hypothetical protein
MIRRFDEEDNINRVPLGSGLTIEYNKIKDWAKLYRNGQLIKQADFSDKTAKKIFIIDTVELGGMPTKLAEVLEISRQTIHNYIGTKKYFGLEGLIHGYNPEQTKSKREQRKMHRGKRRSGDTAKILMAIRREERDVDKRKQYDLFNISEAERKTVDSKDQCYSEVHDWQASRYAGVFCYLITLVHSWRWLDLIQGYFGIDFRIFLIFLLMSARNIRSIEQLKNVRKREVGLLLGLVKLPARNKIWELFYQVACQKISFKLTRSLFLYQIRTGLVGLWFWFTDGHLLPYDGKYKVHYSYKTQSQRPYPGQTNFVTNDQTGRIVDFEIQEGKGDLHGRIKAINQSWSAEVPMKIVQVFDRENYGAERFIEYVEGQIAFVCWDKNVDNGALKQVDDDLFTQQLTHKQKEYRYFESEKAFTYAPEDKSQPRKSVILRLFTIWNVSCNRRTCVLACPQSVQEIEANDCVTAILSRWGASENTFKHVQDRHPFHYHPGFRLTTSENQEIANPAVKEKEQAIQSRKKRLAKLYRELSRAEVSQSGRQNSIFDRLKNEIVVRETEIKGLQEIKQSLPDKIDVSSLQDYKSFKKIDNEGKNLFDFVISAVWNARKLMVDWLRDYYHYENYLVDLFYAITESHGWIKSTADEIIVRLEPLQQPKRRLAQEQFCRKLTALYAKMPNGKKMIIEVGAAPIA